MNNIGLHFYEMLENTKQVCTDSRSVVNWGWGLGLGVAWDGAQDNSLGVRNILYDDCGGSPMDKSFVKTHQCIFCT